MKTKVRIAVAVDPTGDWHAVGWKTADDHEKMVLSTEHLDPGEARYWLEAELDVPEIRTATPTVIPA